MCDLLKTEFMFELSGYVWTKGDNASWEPLQLSEIDMVFINKHWNTEIFTSQKKRGCLVHRIPASWRILQLGPLASPASSGDNMVETYLVKASGCFGSEHFQVLWCSVKDKIKLSVSLAVPVDVSYSTLSCTVAPSPPRSDSMCQFGRKPFWWPFLLSQSRSVPLNALGVWSQMMLDGSLEGRWCMLSCLSLWLSVRL